MRKKYYLILAGMLIFTLAGCKKNDTSVSAPVVSEPIPSVSTTISPTQQPDTSSSGSSEDTVSFAEQFFDDDLDLFVGTDHVYTDLTVTGKTKEGDFNGVWSLDLTEKERYISGYYSIQTTQVDSKGYLKEISKNTDTAYYINKDDIWNKYSLQNTAEGAMWLNEEIFDEKTNIYYFLKSVNYQKIENATVGDVSIFTNGTYDLSNDSEIIQSYMDVVDISEYDLSKADLLLVEDSDGTIRKIDFCVYGSGDNYIKFSFLIKEYDTAEELSNKPF